MTSKVFSSGTPPDSPRGSFNLFPSVSESPKNQIPQLPETRKLIRNLETLSRGFP